MKSDNEGFVESSVKFVPKEVFQCVVCEKKSKGSFTFKSILRSDSYVDRLFVTRVCINCSEATRVAHENFGKRSILLLELEDLPIGFA